MKFVGGGPSLGSLRAAADEDRRFRLRRGFLQRNQFPPPAPPADPLIQVQSASLAHGFWDATNPILKQSVWVKDTWANPWQLVPYLHCTEAAWCLSPSLPSASFVWRYGKIKQTSTLDFQNFAKLAEQNNLYVKVIFEFQEPSIIDPTTHVLGTREWFGILELDQDTHGAGKPLSNAQGKCATGRQSLTAYGMEYLLKRRIITNARWYDATWTTDRITEAPPDFNADGKPNRTDPIYQAASHIFEYREAHAKYWSTLDIIKYLLSWQTPLPIAYDWDVATWHGLNALTWDRPTVKQAGRSPLDIIHELLDRRHLMSSWWQVDGTAPVAVELRTNTLATTAVNIDQPGAPTIPANNRKRSVRFDEDQFTRATVKNSGVATYDRIICRGAEIPCVGSFSVYDGTLSQGWSNAQETAYLAAASGVTGYGSLALDKQRKSNKDYRNRPELRDVYSFYVVPESFMQVHEVGGGEAGYGTSDLFPKPHSYDATVLPFWKECHAESKLPLLEGVDYSGTKIASDAVDESTNQDEKYSSVMVFLKRDSTENVWALAERYGAVATNANTEDTKRPTWSARVSIPANSHGFRLNVMGGEQHELEGAYFNLNKLAADKEVGDLDASASAGDEMIATLSLPSGRHCEGAWPITEPSGDAPRTRYFDFGDDYIAAYVAPNTVVGVDTDGSLQRSTGGWIPAIGPDDNFSKLRSSAKQLHHYYSVVRHVLDFETIHFRSDDQIRLGDLIESIGGTGGDQYSHYQEINSFISQISIRHPQGKGNNRPVPMFHVTTWAGELDPIRPRPYRPQVPVVHQESSIDIFTEGSIDIFTESSMDIPKK